MTQTLTHTHVRTYGSIGWKLDGLVVFPAKNHPHTHPHTHFQHPSGIVLMSDWVEECRRDGSVSGFLIFNTIEMKIITPHQLHPARSPAVCV